MYNNKPNILDSFEEKLTSEKKNLLKYNAVEARNFVFIS